MSDNTVYLITGANREHGLARVDVLILNAGSSGAFKSVLETEPEEMMRDFETGMGQAVADEVGFEEPPLTVEQSAKGVVEQIDALTLENSGQFHSYDGTILPW
ncbi:hypothetical protein N0V88_006916 [Collariella sp. IMI 366227]|nr:hypothetical protein N0V88_006916 [Collariella sp. IMI 366227]